MLKKAQEDPSNHYYLVIEELNRGNAPAIFGEIFQLLDRKDAEFVPIIAMSANAFAEDIINCKLAGMNMHLLKLLDETK